MNNECKSCGIPEQHKDCSCNKDKKVFDRLQPADTVVRRIDDNFVEIWSKHSRWEEYRPISKTNQDDDSIRQDNEQAISKDIDVDRRKREFLSATNIADTAEFKMRLRAEQLRTKPRVIYYQNGECQRTLI